MLARSSNARTINGPTGNLVIGNAKRSSTANRNRSSERSPAIHRRRRTETVSTSTRSGADTAEAAESRARASRPAASSSPTTLAMTDPSTTITGEHVHRGDRRRRSADRLAPRTVQRPARGPQRRSAIARRARVRLSDTAAATGLRLRRGAGGSRGLRGEGSESAHSACFHYACILPGSQVDPSDDRESRYGHTRARIRRFGRVEVRGEQLIITRAGPAVVTTASSVLFPSSAPSTWASTTTTRSCIGWSVPRFARVCPAQPPVSVEIAHSASSRVLPRPDWAVASRSDRPLIVTEVMWREVPLRLAIIQSFLETMNKSG
jgi:hypothetical protein